MGRLWEGMGMGGRGNDRWSRWQHSQPFTLNHYNHYYNYYNYYFYNYHQSQAPSSRGYEPFTLVRVAAMIVCYYLWWSEYLLQGLSIPWYMTTIDLSKYVLCHMVLDCMSCIGIMRSLARFCRTPHADTHYHSVPVLWILWILFAWSCVPHLDLLNATIIMGFYDWEILKQDRNVICNSFFVPGATVLYPLKQTAPGGSLCQMSLFV